MKNMRDMIRTLTNTPLQDDILKLFKRPSLYRVDYIDENGRHGRAHAESRDELSGTVLRYKSIGCTNISINKRYDA